MHTALRVGWSRLLPLGACLLLLGACHGRLKPDTTPPPAELGAPAQPAPPSSAPPALLSPAAPVGATVPGSAGAPGSGVRPDGVVTTLRGTLRYTPIPASMSVEAYLGEELVLTDGDRRWVLTESAQVSRQTLVGLDGKVVSLTAQWVAASAPSPMEAAPLGPDGKPLARADRWRVLAVTSP